MQSQIKVARKKRVNGPTHSPPPALPLRTQGTEREASEEEDVEGEDVTAPVELLMEVTDHHHRLQAESAGSTAETIF